MIAARNRADIQIMIVIGSRFLAHIDTPDAPKPPVDKVQNWKVEAEEALRDYDTLAADPEVPLRMEHSMDYTTLKWLIKMLGG